MGVLLMLDFKFKEVFSVLWKTKSFMIFRFLVYFGITLAYIIGTGAGAGVGALIGKVAGEPEAGIFYGVIGGFGLVSGVLYFVREYLLYIVKAGHIAVILKILDNEEIPQGKGQISYAHGIVKERFKETSVLFAVDQGIKGVVKFISRLFSGILNFLPIIPKPIIKFAEAIIKNSMTYVDEIILAYNIKNEIDNPWEGSKKAVVLYAQNYKAFLKNAVFVTITTWILTALVMLLTFGPIAALLQFTGQAGGAWPIMIAIVASISIKAALIDPFAMTALMQVFFKVTKGQEPNPEWEDKLDQGSKKFREMKEKATSWVSQKAPTKVSTKSNNDLPAQS